MAWSVRRGAKEAPKGCFDVDAIYFFVVGSADLTSFVPDECP